jgi:hypothetical protein
MPQQKEYSNPGQSKEQSYSETFSGQFHPYIPPGKSIVSILWWGTYADMVNIATIFENQHNFEE